MDKDEEVIRRRHIINGGENDKKLNLIMKLFIKWVNSNESLANRDVLMNTIFSNMALCEYNFIKSRIMSDMTSAEIEAIDNFFEETTQDIQKAKQELEKNKVELEEAKALKKKRLEYEAIAKLIEQLPDKKLSEKKLQYLENQLRLLQMESEILNKRFEHFRKQFHVLLTSVHQMEALESSCENLIGNYLVKNSQKLCTKKTDQQTQDFTNINNC